MVISSNISSKNEVLERIPFIGLLRATCQQPDLPLNPVATSHQVPETDFWHEDMKPIKELNHAARIWCFDGGGPKVISQLHFVNEIMESIRRRDNLPEVPRPYHYADLMVGTEFGAVAAILMARMGLTAKEAMEEIIELGRSVFVETTDGNEIASSCGTSGYVSSSGSSRNNGETRTASTVSTIQRKGANGTRFDIEDLKRAVNLILQRRKLKVDARMVEYLSEFGINDPERDESSSKSVEEVEVGGKPYVAALTVYAESMMHCRPIRSYVLGLSDYNPRPTIVDTILATMATPPWFGPVSIKDGHFKESLRSGALGYNNPTEKALEEAQHLFGSDCAVAAIINFGSGVQNSLRLTGTSLEELSLSLQQALMDCEGTAKDLQEKLATTGTFHRLSIDKPLNDISDNLWSYRDIEIIITDTKVYVQEQKQLIQAVVEPLVNKQGTYTLGQIKQVTTKPFSAKAPPTLTPFFVPRKFAYDHMYQQLIVKKEKRFVICGLGGSGKTQLSSYFHLQNRNSYKYTFFLDASTEENIQSDIRLAVRSLGVKHLQATYKDAELFLQGSESGSWLAILDNANDNKLVAKYLSLFDSSPGYIIVTTNNKVVVRHAPQAHCVLEGIDEKDAVNLLLKASQIPPPATEKQVLDAKVICETVGGLPLALVQIGCYCFETSISFGEYLDRLEKYRADLMQRKPDLHLDLYEKSAYASIAMSYECLDPLARSLLHILSFFHPSGIPYDILSIAVKHNFEGQEKLLPPGKFHEERVSRLKQVLTPHGSWNQLDIDSLLSQLQRFLLITLSSSPSTITTINMHRLVQYYARDILSPEDRHRYSRMSIAILSACGWREETYIFQYLLPHIREMKKLNEQISINDMAALGFIFYRAASYKESIDWWIMAKDACFSRKDVTGRAIFRPLYHLAHCLTELQQDKEAEGILGKVIELAGEDMSVRNEDILDCEFLLATIYNKQRKYSDAEDILRRILYFYEKERKPTYRRTLETKSTLAAALSKQGKYAEANTIFGEITPIIAHEYQGHDIYFTNLHHFSSSLMKQEEYEAAISNLDLLAKGSAVAYGKLHHTPVTTLHNKGMCLRKLMQWDEAEKTLNEVLEKRKKSLGESHRLTEETLKELKKLSRDKKRQDRKRISSPISPEGTNSNLVPPSPSVDGNSSDGTVRPFGAKIVGYWSDT